MMRGSLVGSAVASLDIMHSRVVAAMVPRSVDVVDDIAVATVYSL
jgi:hypothetical protein